MNVTKSIYKTSGKHYLMGRGPILSPKIGNRARMSPPLLFKRDSKFKIELELIKGQTHRSMEQRTQKQTLTNLPSSFLTKMQKQFNRRRIAILTNAGTIGYKKQSKKKQEKNLYLSLTCYTKINSKLDYGLTHKMQNCKTQERKTQKKILEIQTKGKSSQTWPQKHN